MILDILVATQFLLRSGVAVRGLDLVMRTDLGGAHGKMDGFSTSVAKELFERRPECERHASEEPGARPGGLDRDHCLWVRFRGSTGDDEHLLELATYDDEITVSLGPFAHLHMGEDMTRDGALERLLDRVLELMDDLHDRAPGGGHETPAHRSNRPGGSTRPRGRRTTYGGE